MNILITNDDGFGAWGIEAITDRLAKEHNVYVVAPDGNRSGSGMSVNFTKPLLYRKMGSKMIACSGSPVDCVIGGLKADILDAPIDLVISGINHGPNIGTDIMYSGTCSAAKQATLLGTPSIAVSLSITHGQEWNDRNSWNFTPLADFVADNLEQLISLARPSIADDSVCDRQGIFVNVNAFDFDSYKGVKMTRCCFIRHDDNTKISVDDIDPEDFTVMLNNITTEAARLDGSDFAACKEGYISVTRVIAEPADEPGEIKDITWTL